MRRFLKKILIFAAIISLLFLAGELIVRRIPSSYSYKNDYIERHGDKVATLILGSSHTYYGVVPSLLGDSVFNLANISQMPEYDLALLEHYAPSLPNLRRLILPVSYFTFTDRVFEETDDWKSAIPYKTQMHLPLHGDLSVYNFELTNFPVYCEKLKNLLMPKPSNKCDSLGFGLNYDLSTRSKHWKEGAEERVRSNTSFDPEREKTAVATIRKILDYCREKGIECVLITTPTHAEFRKYADRRQLREMYRNVRGLQKRYSVRYLDYDADGRFTDDDFHDVDHLSDLGAGKLTLLLRDNLR